MEIALALTVTAVMIGVTAVLSNRERSRREAIFRAVAKRRKGTFERAGWSDRPRLTVSSYGIKIVVEVWSTKNTAYTDWSAYVPPSGTAWFQIYPERVTSLIGKAFGAQDVRVFASDSEFDQRFMVKGYDAALVRRLWTAERARTLLDRYATSRINSDGSKIHLERPQRMTDEADVDAGIEFMLELAGADLFGLRALQALPDARYFEAAPLPHVVITGPGNIQIGPVERERRFHTCAQTTTAVGERWALDIVDGALGGPDLDRLPDAARRHAKAIGSARIVADGGEARIEWSTVETDPDRLGAAIELLRALSQAPSLGVFR